MAAEVWDDLKDSEFAFILQPSSGILIDFAIYSLGEVIHPFIYSADGANNELWTVVSNTGSSEAWA